MKQDPNFQKAIVDKTCLPQQITECVRSFIPQVVDCMNSLYADSYPANIFKNATKCKEIYQKMIESE